MSKLGLKAFGIILKKVVFLANHKFASKSEVGSYNNPSVVGTHLTFPVHTTAKIVGTHLVLAE